VDSPRQTTAQIHWLGTLAKDLISTEQTAAVFGIISRGIFIKTDNERMIFLSFENYRGPLTANLSGDWQRSRETSAGERAIISKEGILFPDSGIRISTSSAKIWDPPIPMESPLSADERTGLIRKLALNAYQQKGSVGLSEMLPLLAGFDPGDGNRDNLAEETREKINKIRQNLSKGDLRSSFPIIQSFLGLGTGLTPSGDDLIIGLLLSLNRWKSVTHPGETLSTLNDQVIEAAFRSTTTLSANLIESATLGLADERLIQAVDYLAVGEDHPSEVLKGLLDWGSSSGVDALVGMITAFLPV
jgi:hypothetical protein